MQLMMLSLSYSPWQGWRLSSSLLGRTGPLLGLAGPREGAETDPSPRPLHCDWAYKPGGGVGGSAGKKKKKREDIKAMERQKEME